MAMYLYARFHESLEDFPNFALPSEWYGIKLLKSNANVKQAMTYKTQYKAMGDAFLACGIISKSKTCHGKEKVAPLAEMPEVPDVELRTPGRWNVAAMEYCFRSKLPHQDMRELAGWFLSDQSNFRLPRDILVPVSLLSKVFPEVEHYEDAWTAKLPNDRDLATGAFLKLLKYFRKVLLQDSIALMNLYPDLPIWKTPVFQSEEYLSWKQREVKEVEERQTTMSLSLEQAMPHLSKMIKEQYFDVIHHLDQLHHEARSLNPSLIDAIIAGVKQTNSILQQWCTETVRVSGCSPLQHNSSSADIPASMASISPSSNARKRVGATNNCATKTTNHLLHVGMSRVVDTVRNLWLEWNVGLAGHASIREMEELHGTRWRRKAGESKFFCRRKKIIDAVLARSSKRGGSIEESLDFFTQAQGSRTLDWLSKNIAQF